MVRTIRSRESPRVPSKSKMYNFMCFACCSWLLLGALGKAKTTLFLRKGTHNFWLNLMFDVCLSVMDAT